VLAVAIASDSPGMTAGAAGAALVAVKLPNSRTAETEADRIGIELAARAGFDPRAAVTLWEKMEKVSGGSPVDFLSTHPSSGKRQDRLGQLVPEMMPYYEDQSQRPVYPL
jgi:predicted Zn-dependent protease